MCWCCRLAFGDDLEVGFAVDLDAGLLNARALRSHLLGVSRLADGHQVRALGHVLLGELDGDLVLTFDARHVHARVRLQAVIVGDHRALVNTQTNRHGFDKLTNIWISDMELGQFVTQRPSDPGIQRPGDPVDPVTLFYNELQMSTYV